MRFLPCCPPLHEVTPADRVAHARALESRNIGEHEKKDTKRPRKVHAGTGVRELRKILVAYRRSLTYLLPPAALQHRLRARRTLRQLEETPMSPITTAS